MEDNVYKIITLAVTSTECSEKAAASAVEMVTKSLHGLRIAEIKGPDMQL